MNKAEQVQAEQLIEHQKKKKSLQMTMIEKILMMKKSRMTKNLSYKRFEKAYEAGRSIECNFPTKYSQEEEEEGYF